MKNSTKILTVSYGTFSCTLKGFDDSFEAMKEIAEYFRDLAADDRYFGAEPPQPDAEVLARMGKKRGLTTFKAEQDDTAKAEGQRTTAHAGGMILPQEEMTASAAAFFAQSPSIIPQEDADATEELRPAEGSNARFHDVGDGLSDKLKRIRAAAAARETATLDDRYEEDEQPDDPVALTARQDGAVAPDADAQRVLLDAVEDISGAMTSDDETEDAASADEHHKEAQALEAVLRRLETGDTDEDVSRLMAVADAQMQDPEGTTRRNAFAHLKAAVAARFADRSLEEATKKGAEKEAKAFRSDLAEVVKPHQPAVNTETAQEPPKAQIAPLRLVAEQRIDLAVAAQSSPSPLRVGHTEDARSELQDTGFTAYAKQHGASELPDVIEAAAAYIAYVKGEKDFTRPQLMAHVHQAKYGPFSREDGLRAFGKLLRSGKVRKTNGGRFGVSDEIRYKPQNRAIS